MWIGIAIDHRVMVIALIVIVVVVVINVKAERKKKSNSISKNKEIHIHIQASFYLRIFLSKIANFHSKQQNPACGIFFEKLLVG